MMMMMTHLKAPGRQIHHAAVPDAGATKVLVEHEALVTCVLTEVVIDIVVQLHLMSLKPLLLVGV